MKILRISHPNNKIEGEITLDGSKSISNRVLIIRALCESNFGIDNLSTSDDTKILRTLLEQKYSDIYDVGHAGTSFRFLTAFLAFKDGTQTLTGSDRMKERPIGPLVKALRSIGAQIEYLGEEGFPPLKIKEPDRSCTNSRISIEANVSSQYLTALMLIAPILPDGLEINLLGNLVSESYMTLTMSILKDFGIRSAYDGRKIKINRQSYIPKQYFIEADWSACSYYYSIVSIAKHANLRIHGLFENSGQGDSGIVNLAEKIGVNGYFEGSELCLSKGSDRKKFSYNFINQPDIAQTLAVVCAAKGINGQFTGLKTLRIKETDRIAALDIELSKVNCKFSYLSGNADEIYGVSGTAYSPDYSVPRFATYHDHRMAMSFAPLSLLFPIEVEDPMVVSKSYPNFWDDMTKLGFEIAYVD